MDSRLRAVFADPPAAFRPMPQWSWNGALTRARIRAQLAQFAAQGCGGLFTHARPGHVTGYLGDAYMDLWRFALDEAARLGMAFHIYDEFMCPAGHAGGLVTAEKPHLAVQELTLVPMAGLTRYPPASLGTWRVEAGAGGTRRLVAATDAEARAATPATPAWAMVIEPQAGSPRYGGHPFPDLLRRETTDAFLASTHERYATWAGEAFGVEHDGAPGAPDRGVRFMFCDEPMLVSSGGLPLSRDVLRHFRRDHGYDLLDHVAALAWGAAAATALPPSVSANCDAGSRPDVRRGGEDRISPPRGEPDGGTSPDIQSVRFDYWWTVNRLLNEAFMQPVAAWCAAHNLLFTGHLMEHEWPSPRSHASAMASLRWMQAPGTDLLGFQFEATTPEANGLYLLNLVELRSVKRQLGRDWMLVETCGGGGYERAFDLFKPLEDLVLAFGFNVIDPHLSHQTLAGIRKYDWPQTLSDHSPWWAHYRQQADHVARVNAALCAGTDPGARVLVLHPTTTGWLHYTAPVFQRAVGGDDGAMAALREGQVDLVLALLGAQIDFDLGDELILEELASVADSELLVGAGPCARYETVVVPAGMETWTSSTLALMTAYLEAGGIVVAARRSDGTSAPPLVDGRPSDAPRALAERYAEQWRVVADAAGVTVALREIRTPPLTGPAGSRLPAGLVWRRVELPDGGWLWFFCNPWAEAIGADVRLPGRSVRAMGTANGSVAPLAAETDGEHVVVRLDLPPRGHALWWVTEDNAPPAGPQVGSQSRRSPHAVALELEHVARLQPNLLMLDYCQVTVVGGGPDLALDDGQAIHHLAADTALWRALGFEGNPWQGAHQFKRTIIDRPLDPERGCRLTYTFQVDPALPSAARKGLQLGIERPWLYTVTLNGQPLDVAGAAPWLDEEMRAVSVGEHVRAGANVLQLAARPVQMLCEVMPVTLIGDFDARPAEAGFVAAPAGRLELGDWSQQGLGFYAGTVRYAFAFEVSGPGAQEALVTLPAWQGACAVVHLDGDEAGLIVHPPYRLRLGALKAGAHRLAIDVVSALGGMLGPHHAEGLPGHWTWANAPRQQPAGGDYRTCPTGLLAMPELRPA